MPTLQSEIDNILAPHRKQGTLSPALRTDVKQKIIGHIFKLFVEHFKSLSAEDAKAFYRKALLISHPDKIYLKEDLVINEEIVLSYACMQEINTLSKTSATSNELFRIIAESYKAYLNPDKTQTEEIVGELSFTQWLQQFLIYPQFYTTSQGKIVSLPWNALIYARVSDEEYYAGHLGPWIAYNLQKNLYHVLAHAPNKNDTFRALFDILSQGEHKEFFSNLKDPRNSYASFLQTVFSSVYHRDGSIHLPPAPKLLPPSEAIIQYHLRVAEEELIRYEASANPASIAVRGWQGPLGTPLLSIMDKTHYFEAQLYLSLQHILYADPTSLENFLHLGRAEIKKPADPAHTEKQYHALRALFSNPHHPLAKRLNNIISPRWNWLLNATDWMITQGIHAPIARPWVAIKENTKEDYLAAAMNAYLNRMVKKTYQTIEHFAIAKRVPPIFLTLLPSLFTATLFPLLLKGFLLINLLLGVLAPLFCVFAIQGTGFLHSLLEGALLKLSQIHQPFSSPPSLHVPRFLQAYHGQVIAPLWRIISQPLDDYYSPDQKHALKRSYPTRVLLGLGLSLLTSLSFVAVETTLHISTILAVSIIGLSNLPFALVDLVKNIPRWREYLPSLRSKKAETKNASSFTEPFHWAPAITFLIEGPRAKPTPSSSSSDEAKKEHIPVIRPY